MTVDEPNGQPPGRRIHDARVAAGLTQVELAARVEVTGRQVSRWETGDTTTPRLRTRMALVEALGVDL